MQPNGNWVEKVYKKVKRINSIITLNENKDLDAEWIVETNTLIEICEGKESDFQ